jgi:trans-aconitate methyltransferase
MTRETHGDSWNDGVENRIYSARTHLQMLELPTDVLSILEIGPGRGGVSEALRERYPHASILGVDVDPRAVNSLKHGLDRLELTDVTETPGLIVGVDLTIALRTPPNVVEFLEYLKKSGHPGMVVVSQINEMAEEAVLIRRLRDPSSGAKIVPLVEGRSFNEYGFVWR